MCCCFLSLGAFPLSGQLLRHEHALPKLLFVKRVFTVHSSQDRTRSSKTSSVPLCLTNPLFIVLFCFSPRSTRPHLAFFRDAGCEPMGGGNSLLLCGDADRQDCAWRTQIPQLNCHVLMNPTTERSGKKVSLSGFQGWILTLGLDGWGRRKIQNCPPTRM